jgi:hypothetical protein
MPREQEIAMAKKSVPEHAAAVATRVHKLKSPLIADHVEARDPKTGMALHQFKVVAAADPNGASYTVLLDDDGEAVQSTPALETLFHRVDVTAAGAGPAPAMPAAPITIQPDVNILTLNPGDTLDETITVTVPKNAGPAMADVYFLADTTGSMGGILNAVQAGANNVLTALNGLGINMMFGVGNYKDFGSGDPYGFKHQVSPTNVTANVTAGINAWSAAGGSDLPEADLFALDSLAVPPGGTIGWRAGSKRIVVWFGDAPGHDPVCAAISGAAAAVTEASATARLVAEGITVLAISTANPGLDADPKLGATDYTGTCGAPGGLPGQGTRIANATGGAFVTGINPGNIVNTIINLVTGAVAAIQNIKLVPSASVAPFIVSITPAAGYGPLAGDTDHVLKFEVKFAGIPCKPEVQHVSGTIDAVADGTVVASKKVDITVPACAFVYVVKYVCGVQPDCGCECAPVQPGKYATEINIHNYSLKRIEIRKRFVPLVLAGAPIGREPRVSGVRAEDKILLPPQAATMDDCCRIAELLLGGEAPSPMPLMVGFLEITASAEIAVTAVYTASDATSGGVSLAVEQIAGRRL